MGIFDKFKKKENDGYESMCSKMGTEFVNLYIRQKGIIFEISLMRKMSITKK